MLVTIVVYFALLFIISRLVGNSGNKAFFGGSRKSSWLLVAFGMIGASLSGVTFISVPGMIISNDMTYLQMCIGFIFGYLVVAFCLLPFYYRNKQISIYAWLNNRIGLFSHKTAASFFILSKLAGAAARMYVVVLILYRYVFDNYGFTYVATVVMILSLIWLYTCRGGIRTLVWTDALQTFCLLAALVIVVYKAIVMLNMNVSDAVTVVLNDSHSRVFEFDDWTSRQHFVKQFLSGVFIVVVMTGLDQGMMQKNLACKNLREAQKDMCSYGFMFVPVNFLFLFLGALVMMLYAKFGMPIPSDADSLMTGFVAEGMMGDLVVVLFTIGIIAPAFSSTDSSITALTTSVCIDMLNIESDDFSSKNFLGLKSRESVRKFVHAMVVFALGTFVVAFKYISDGSVIDTIYYVASYTYGPLLGLFIFGLFTKRVPKDKHVPFIAILSPVLCYALNHYSKHFWNYEFGYELLLLNGLLTIIALYVSSMFVYQRNMHIRRVK